LHLVASAFRRKEVGIWRSGILKVTTAGGGNRRLRSVSRTAGASPFDEVEGWYEGVAAKKATGA
jgi:hypothetical protein